MRLNRKSKVEEEETTINDSIEDEMSNESVNEEVKEASEPDISDKEEMILYLITDRKVPGLINYFRECGVNLSNIYTSVDEATDTISMQSDRARIVVADTGLGKFTSTKIRHSLIDLLGICDENNKVSVFYTDSVIKVDSMSRLGKDADGIDWLKYSGTADMVAKILQYKENYVLDYLADESEDMDDTSHKELCGMKSKLDFGELIVVDGLVPEELNKNMEGSEYQPIVSYTVKI